MMVRWNQHTRAQDLIQPNLTHFANSLGPQADASNNIFPYSLTRVIEETTQAMDPISPAKCVARGRRLGRVQATTEVSL